MKKLVQAKPDAVILREKDLTGEEYKALGEKVLKICTGSGILCIFHTFIKEAAELGGKAIHIPLPLLRTLTEEEKTALKKDFSLTGTSCHSVEEAREAERLGCAYIIAGHIFDTDCKRGAPGRGTEFLQKVCRSVSIPVFAIGGIQEDTAGKVRGTGAKGCCVMSSAMKCENPGEYLEGLRRELR